MATSYCKCGHARNEHDWITKEPTRRCYVPGCCCKDYKHDASRRRRRSNKKPFTRGR